MVEKLKLLGKSQRLRLLLKSLLLGAASFLFWRGRSGGGLSVILFLAFGAFLYLRPLFNATRLLRSFLVFIILSIFARELYISIGVGDLFSGAAAFWGGIYPLASILIFYVTFGLKEYVLVRRQFWHFFLFAALFYQITFTYFLAEAAGFVSVVAVIVPAILVFLIFSELIEIESRAARPAALLSAGVFSLIFVEGLFVVQFLPIGFFNAVNIVALGGLFFGELALHFYNGSLGKKILVSRLAILAVLACAIFLTSKWGL